MTPQQKLLARHALDIPSMPRRLSPQQKFDEDHGITPRACIVGALRVTIGGPSWLITMIADVIELTFRKMGFKIVPMERADYQ